MKGESYKVLLVEDEDKHVEGTKITAIDYNLTIERFSNWGDAKKELELHFDEYSAIILDPVCVYSAGEVAEGLFLGRVMSDMRALFEKYDEYIPWYVLTAGGDGYDDYTDLMQIQREQYEGEWGKMIYYKAGGAEDERPEKLFENIKKVAPKRKVTRILNRHKETFNYIKGEGKLIDEYIDGEEVGNVLLKMLAKVYFPEENNEYQINRNDMRKIVECLFNTAEKYRLLSKKCFNEDGSRNLLDCCRSMSGKMVRGEVHDDAKVVFPSCTGDLLRSLLNYTNDLSHYDSIKNYCFVERGNNELLISNVFNLCYIITCLGKYIKEHSIKKK